MIGPVSTPSSTKWTVQPVTFAPYASASRTPWAPGKAGQQGGVGVDEPAAEAGEELLAHDLHEPGGDDEVGLVRGGRLGERRVPLLTGLVVLDPAHEGGQPGPLGALQARDAVAVGPDGDDLGAVALGAGGRRWRRAGPGGWCRNRRPARRGAGRAAATAGPFLAGNGCSGGLCGHTNASRPRIRGTLRSGRPPATIPAHRTAPDGTGAWPGGSVWRTSRKLASPRHDVLGRP